MELDELESELSEVRCDSLKAATCAIFLRCRQHRCLSFQLEMLSTLLVLLGEDSVEDWVDVWSEQIYIEEVYDVLVSQRVLQVVYLFFDSVPLDCPLLL